MAEAAANAPRAAEAAARQSYGKLVAYLAARTRDVAAAEDALSEAFAAALADWHANGVPDCPEAWLLAVARRRMIDAVRRAGTRAGASAHLLMMADELQAAEDAMRDMDIPDRRLALMFACAHPAIEAGIRAPLMLQTVLGFDAARIASAFLVSPAAMSQRLLRAKTKIRQAGIPFHIPAASELAGRLDAVLAAVYAVFSEGWSGHGGLEDRRAGLTEEAIFLGRLVAALFPQEPEALGLLSLMLHAEARRAARRTAEGEYVPLAEQDTALWDGAMVDEAEALLARASRMEGGGRYQMEAAVQSAHAVRRIAGSADWRAIAAIYAHLLRVSGSPVVAVNHAAAVAEMEGPDAGLALLDAVAGDARLENYQPFWAARASLLHRTGARVAADEAYARAIGLEADPAVRRFLQRRRAMLAEG
ncbi:DUF6596 domain-containing protein [Aquabacter sp. CN5-332]|uniref:RNA polymerase sigma factor n=1 Tax=Aquabacter sp. CN5-332 TaxID=3156608 RepID=UPI0032B50DC3